MALDLSGSPRKRAFSSRYSLPDGLCSGHTSRFCCPGIWFGSLHSKNPHNHYAVIVADHCGENAKISDDKVTNNHL